MERVRFLTAGNGPRARERGAAAVEFALVLPLLLLLVFATIEFGWLINRETNLNHAAREGAREGLFNSSDVDIEASARGAIASLDQTRVTVDVTCRKADDTACPGVDFPAEWESGGTVALWSYERSARRVAWPIGNPG